MQVKSHLKLRALCEGAVMVAIAQIVSYIKLFEFPNGGAISLGMLPIFIFCSRWGFASGMLSSFAYAILQLLLDGAYAWGWQSIVGDYILAFAVIGIAGLFHGKKNGFFIGVVAGSVARFIIAYLVGVLVWGEYMPESFFGMTMTTPWIYSAIYNGSYILIDIILCLVVGRLMWISLGKYIRGEDLC